MSNPQADILAAHLHGNMEAIQYVHDNMAAIRAVADHLTPVEDLVEFQNEVAYLYAELGLLVEASQIIIRATQPGLDLLLAADVAQQRGYLQLKSAALQEANYFATAVDLTALRADVTSLQAAVTGIMGQLPGLATDAELEAVRAALVARIVALETAVADGSIGGDLQEQIDVINGAIIVHGQLITTITARVDANDGSITGLASAYNGLSATVTAQGDNISAIASDVVDLHTEVSNTALGLTAIGDAVQILETRTDIIDGTVSSHSSSITTLNAEVVDLDAQVAGQGGAISALTTRVTSSEEGIDTLSNSVTQLDGRVVDAEAGLLAQGEATTELSVRVTATEDGMVVVSEDITQLQASITSTGNQLPNAAFEYDVRNWTMFSRGSGWLTGALTRNLDAASLPPGVGTLGISVTGVPAGDSGTRSTNVPVEPSTSYILSAYLAATNCTLRLEYRILDGAGTQLAFGVIGSVTNVAPATDLNGWQRKYGTITVPAGGVSLQVQLWVTAANTASPKAWMLRPMLEERIGNQTLPSPWVAGVTGMEEVLATALQTLTVRVDNTEDSIEAISEAITDLESSVGTLQGWQINTHSGSGDGTSLGAPLSAGLRKVSDGTLVHTFLRGLTLLRFGLDGELDTAVRYDTFASSTERDNLEAALLALTQSDPFVLVSRDNHGIKDASLTAAMESCGALAFTEVSGSRNYVLMGRGLLDKGGGVEVLSTGEDRWLQHKFQLINDTPLGIGENGVGFTVAGQATALSSLTTRVTSTEGAITAISADVVDLDARVDIAETGITGLGSALATLDTRVDATEGSITVLSGAVTALDSRIDDTEADISTTASALSALTTRVTSAEGVNTAQAGDLVSLDSRLDSAEGTISTTSGALTALTTRVTSAEGVNTSQAGALTALDGRITAAEGVNATQGTALTSLDLRLDSAEGSITAFASDITDLEVSIGDIGGENMLFNSSFEIDENANGQGDNFTFGTTGTSFVIARVASSLPGGIYAQQLTATLTNAQQMDVISNGANPPQVHVGKNHIFSAYARGTVGTQFRQYIQFLNAANAVLLTITGPMIAHTTAYQRTAIEGIAPAGSVKAYLFLRTYGAGAGAASAFCETDNWMFQVGKVMTNWQAGGSIELAQEAAARQTLAARVTATEGVNTSQATFLTELSAGTGAATHSPNLLSNPSFDVDTTGWSHGGTGGSFLGRFIDTSGGYAGMGASGVGLYRTAWFDIDALPGWVFSYSCDMYKTSTVGVVSCDILFLNSGGGVIATAARAGPILVNGQWTRYGNTYSGPSPAGTAFIRFRFIVEGTNGNDFFRRVKIERSNAPTPYNTEALTGSQARAFSTLSATVTSQGGTITSQGAAITGLTSSLAGKADVSAVTALTTRVSDVEVNGYGANLLPNTTFSIDLNGWTSNQSASPAWGALTRDLAGASWHPTGIHALGTTNGSGGLASGNYINIQSPQAQIGQAGDAFIASAYVAMHRCSGQIYIAWINSAGAVISYTAGQTHDVGGGSIGGTNLASWQRIVATGTAPAGTQSALVLIQFRGNGNATPYGWIIRPMLERKRPTQTLPSEWNSGGLEMSASWTVTLDVNGYITGVALANDGSTGTMAIRADLFSLVPASGSGARTEFSAGNWRVYDGAGTLRVRMGIW